MREVTATKQRGKVKCASSTGPAQQRAMTTMRSVDFATGRSTECVKGTSGRPGSKSPSCISSSMVPRSLSIALSSMSCMIRALGTSCAPCDMACETDSQTWNSHAVASLPERPCITAESAPMERFASEEISRTVRSEVLNPAVKAIASWCTAYSRACTSTWVVARGTIDAKISASVSRDSFGTLVSANISPSIPTAPCSPPPALSSSRAAAAWSFGRAGGWSPPCCSCGGGDSCFCSLRCFFTQRSSFEKKL
mmetsp:Transcript_76125/g.223176  ORF Transcript_76125/g.223176 Transcript_76125/m.223176 type:complete len:252 (-) Transcript_76125:2462-3217(-)